MEIDFLKALKDVLEDIVRTGKVYERSKIDEIAPQYGRAIFSLLKEKETVTVTTGGLVVKPNGNMELLLERLKASWQIKSKRRKTMLSIDVKIT